MNELNWSWIALELTVPPLVGVLLAYPLWRKNEIVLGNIAGTAFLFATAFALIWREYVQIDRLTKQCLDAGVTCWPQPSAFTRFAIYAFISLIEVFVLFSLSLKFEERVRRRDYAPEWQRR